VRVLRAFLVSDLRLYLREPMLALFSFGVPVMLALGLGLPAFAHRADPALGGQRMIDSELPSLVLTMSFAMIGLLGAPTFLAGYRETGMLRRLATTPASPLAVLVSQLIVGLLSALVATAALLTVSWTLIGTAWPVRPLGLVAALVLGVTATMSLGMVVAAVARSVKAAVGMAQLVIQPSCLLAGIYMPSRFLPGWLASTGRATPLGALRWAIEGAQAGTGSMAWPLTILAAWSLGAMGLARWLFRWQ
jgi:ABC-2 type transport system permease protein